MIAASATRASSSQSSNINDGARCPLGRAVRRGRVSNPLAVAARGERPSSKVFPERLDARRHLCGDQRQDEILLRAAWSGRAPEHLEFRVRSDEWLVTAQGRHAVPQAVDVDLHALPRMERRRKEEDVALARERRAAAAARVAAVDDRRRHRARVLLESRRRVRAPPPVVFRVLVVPVPARGPCWQDEDRLG